MYFLTTEDPEIIPGIYFLMVEDLEIIPGIYFLMVEDPEIIPGIYGILRPLGNPETLKNQHMCDVETH